MRRLLPEPFWPTLAALLLLSLLTAIPFYIVCVLLWPHGSALLEIPCYLAGIVLTWWLARRWEARERPLERHKPPDTP